LFRVLLLFHDSNTNIHFSLVREFREKLCSLANGNCDRRDMELGGTFKILCSETRTIPCITCE